MSSIIRNRLFTLAGLVFAVAPIHAATRHVPVDYPTIQSCIYAALPGQDECVVAPGIYHELVDFVGKAVTIRSSGGRDVTIIDGTGLNGSVAKCVNGEGSNSVLDGFTLTGGTGTDNGTGITNGGGMYNYSSSPTVSNCIFEGNAITNGGGGMGNFFNSNPKVRNCRFLDNTSKCGAGMSNEFNSKPTVTDCTFINGTATNLGGGMYNDQSSPTVSNCTFTWNTSVNLGGGMYNVTSANPSVSRCIFNGNHAVYGGGMRNEHNSSPKVSDCTFVGNTADYGGGMYNVVSCAIVSNCTFTKNTAVSGGGMYNYYGNLTLTNCILRGNSPNELTLSVSTPTVRFSDVQGGLPAGVIDGGGNINLDPLFMRIPSDGGDGWGDNPSTTGIDESANDDFGDLRLKPGSPCINTGDPNFVPQSSETDLDGNSRVFSVRVDMGAYEFSLGDYDGNQMVNLSDFAAWSGCATGPRGAQSPPYAPGCEAFDFNANGNIDLADFAQFELVMAP